MGRFKEFFGKKWSTLYSLIAALVIAIALFVISPDLGIREAGLAGTGPPEPTGSPPDQPAFGSGEKSLTTRMTNYEEVYETELKNILEQTVGVGEVEVMVNIDSTEELVVEKDRNIRSQTTKEVDKDRATRDISDQSKEEKVVIVQGDKNQQPFILKTLKPRIRGVLVVAKGAESIQVKSMVIDAVQKVLDVPAYKISVLPKKG